MARLTRKWAGCLTLAWAALHTAAAPAAPAESTPLRLSEDTRGSDTPMGSAAVVTVSTPAYLEALDAIAGLLSRTAEVAIPAADPSVPHTASAGPPTSTPPAPVGPARAARLAQGQDCAPAAEDYPESALRARATGQTRLRIAVDAEGKTGAIEILGSAGPTRAHAALDREAVRKLSGCRFEPARDGSGQAIRGFFDAEISWNLP